MCGKKGRKMKDRRTGSRIMFRTDVESCVCRVSDPEEALGFRSKRKTLPHGVSRMILIDEDGTGQRKKGVPRVHSTLLRL